MNRLFIYILLSCLLITLIMAFVVNREEVVSKSASPTGEFYLVESRFPNNNPFRLGGPGDGDWHRYVYRLYKASTKEKIATSNPQEMPDAESADRAPTWLKDSVCVPHEQYLKYKN